MAECEDLRELEGEEEEETRGSKEHNGGAGSDSSDEDSSEAPLAAQDVDDEGSESSSSCSGPAVREEEGKTEEDTDSDEDNGHHGPRHTDTEEEEGERAEDEEEDGKGQGFTHNGEPEFKPKKVPASDSSDTEDEEKQDGVEDSEDDILDIKDNAGDEEEVADSEDDILEVRGEEKKSLAEEKSTEKSESSEDCGSAGSPDQQKRSVGSPVVPRRSSDSPEDPRRSTSPVEMIGGASGSPPRTPTPEPTASPLELLEAPMAREDEEEEENEEQREEEEEGSSSSSSSPSSPQAEVTKEFPNTEEDDLINSIELKNQNYYQNQNLNQKSDREEIVSHQLGRDEEDLQRAEPATIIVSPNVEEQLVKRMELSPVMEGSPSPDPISKQQTRTLSPVSASIERSPSPNCGLPTEGSLSPEQSSAPLRSSGSPERKYSRGSHGSSSYDEERASSLSPEPTKAIVAPTKVTSPMSPPPAQSNKVTVGKIYNEVVGESDPEERKERLIHHKPIGDITAVYTQKIEEREEQARSPKPERRRESMFQRPEGMTNITQLYTAAFKEERSGDGFVKPVRSGKITKLYTEGFSKECSSFKGKPSDEVTNPRKHNLATTVDKEKVLAAYTDVMSDQKADINWAFFNYTDSTIGVKATGKEFSDFKTHFTPDDRGFGYIKITTGDELSKRSKFVFCTWIGPNVSVMKKAKMGTDKAFVKEVIQNISVELQPESLSEVDAGYFETECRKAGGANYGTGKRD